MTNELSAHALEKDGVVPAVSTGTVLIRLTAAMLGAAVIGQALVVAKVKPQDLVTGVGGMADILRRSFPPDLSHLPTALGAVVETVDIALLGTAVALLFSLPLAVCAASNVSPSRTLYLAARGVIAVSRAVPDLVWALLFVTAVGLGPFPGVLTLSVHSVGMLGRLFAENIEDMDMGPVDALSITGASRAQIVTHAVLPGLLTSLIGVSLFRLDENVRASLGPGLRRRRRYWLFGSDLDESVPVPPGSDAADPDLSAGDQRRAVVSSRSFPNPLAPSFRCRG